MMKYGKRLSGLALMLITAASLSVSAFAADYDFETSMNTEYYPSTSYEDTYDSAYNYGGPNVMDYEVPELPCGSISTTQTGIMEKVLLPGLQQTVGTSISGEYGLSGGLGDLPSGSVSSVKPSVPAYTSVDGMERKDGSTPAPLFCPRRVTAVQDPPILNLLKARAVVRPRKNRRICGCRAAEWAFQEPRKRRL